MRETPECGAPDRENYISRLSELGQLRTLRAALGFVRFRGQSGSRFRAAEGPFGAITGLTPLLEGGRYRAHFDASGESRPPHHITSRSQRLAARIAAQGLDAYCGQFGRGLPNRRK